MSSIVEIIVNKSELPRDFLSTVTVNSFSPYRKAVIGLPFTEYIFSAKLSAKRKESSKLIELSTVVTSAGFKPATF